MGALSGADWEGCWPFPSRFFVFILRNGCAIRRRLGGVWWGDLSPQEVPCLMLVRHGASWAWNWASGVVICTFLLMLGFMLKRHFKASLWPTLWLRSCLTSGGLELMLSRTKKTIYRQFYLKLVKMGLRLPGFNKTGFTILIYFIIRGKLSTIRYWYWYLLQHII